MLVAIGATASLVGCAGGPAEPVGAGDLALARAQAAALPTLHGEQWSTAAAGCEGMLGGGEHFAVTVPDGLVVATLEGSPVCADTFEAIGAELDVLGMVERLEELRAGYMVAMSDRRTLSSSGPTEGEPNPQPNIGSDTTNPTAGIVSPRVAAGPNGGEPNPQPNMSPDQGEPNPQPNIGSDGSTSNTDGTSTTEPSTTTGTTGVRT